MFNPLFIPTSEVVEHCEGPKTFANTKVELEISKILARAFLEKLTIWRDES